MCITLQNRSTIILSYTCAPGMLVPWTSHIRVCICVSLPACFYILIDTLRCSTPYDKLHTIKLCWCVRAMLNWTAAQAKHTWLLSCQWAAATRSCLWPLSAVQSPTAEEALRSSLQHTPACMRMYINAHVYATQGTWSALGSNLLGRKQS